MFLFIYLYIQKIGFDISCKLSPQETFCINCHSLFFSKIKQTISKCRLLLPSMLAVNIDSWLYGNSRQDVFLTFCREESEYADLCQRVACRKCAVNQHNFYKNRNVKGVSMKWIFSRRHVSEVLSALTWSRDRAEPVT